MKHYYQDGKICLTGQSWEKALYDVSNEKISVQFDGKGGLTKYLVGNQNKNYVHSFTALHFNLDGKRILTHADKIVEMIGRTQTLTIKQDGAEVKIKQFLSKAVNGVFYEITCRAENTVALEMVFDCGTGNKAEQEYIDEKQTNIVSGVKFACCCSLSGVWLQENHFFHVKALPARETVVRFLLSFDQELQAKNVWEDFENFEKYKAEAEQEIEDIVLPVSVQTEEEKALYYSCHFVALENHKTSGDFNAFCAGSNYIDVIRTYFRDSYFTVLPMYNGHTDLVRSQILTLAKGISPCGDCPSAVTYKFSDFWGNHFDSPSFFVMMLYDYVQNTGDKNVLCEKIDEQTIFEKAVAVVERLSQYADETGLIYKPGRYNKRDWADEVNRNGYVTYVEVLYARALYCLAKMHSWQNVTGGEKYARKYENVKKAINEILFDDEKGYFVNFKDGDFVERNLSIDTVFAVIFKIADMERSSRVLDAMERLLETRNNQDIGADFGVACVYPPYERLTGASHRSARRFDYHNGANWPYLSAMYAYAKMLYGKEYKYALTSWFSYNCERGYYTPVEYYTRYYETGSCLQAWSGVCAFVFDQTGKKSFFD